MQGNSLMRKENAGRASSSHCSPLTDDLEFLTVSSLDPTPDEIRQWGRKAVDAMADYVGRLREKPVYADTSSAEIREKLESKLPQDGVGFDDLMKAFTETIIPLGR